MLPVNLGEIKINLSGESKEDREASENRDRKRKTQDKKTKISWSAGLVPDTNEMKTKGGTEIPRETRRRETHQKRARKERIQSHWLTMDPIVEMAFFTSSTLAENLNTGETKEPLVGHGSFSRVSFLACT